MRHSDRKTSVRRPSTSDGPSLPARDQEKAAENQHEVEDEKESSAVNTPEKRDSSVKDKRDSSVKEKEKRDSAVLRKRTSSTSDVTARSPILAAQVAGGITLKPGKSILEQIGTPDHNGWMRKKTERYNSWKLRYFILKGPHLYWLKSNDKSVCELFLVERCDMKCGTSQETKIKGYINIVGYKVVVDENIDPGRYGFKIIHDSDKTHFFSHDEQMVIREWMKALMKATISRDFSSQFFLLLYDNLCC